MSWKLMGNTDQSLRVHGDLLGRWSAFFNAYDLTVGLLVDWRRKDPTTTLIGLWVQDWDIVVLVTDSGFGKRLRNRAAKIHHTLGKKVIMIEGEPCPTKYDMEVVGFPDAIEKSGVDYFQFMQCQFCFSLHVVMCQRNAEMYSFKGQFGRMKHKSDNDECPICNYNRDYSPRLMDELLIAYAMASDSAEWGEGLTLLQKQERNRILRNVDIYNKYKT